MTENQELLDMLSDVNEGDGWSSKELWYFREEGTCGNKSEFFKAEGIQMRPGLQLGKVDYVKSLKAQFRSQRY